VNRYVNLSVARLLNGGVGVKVVNLEDEDPSQGNNELARDGSETTSSGHDDGRDVFPTSPGSLNYSPATSPEVLGENPSFELNADLGRRKGITRSRQLWKAPQRSATYDRLLRKPRKLNRNALNSTRQTKLGLGCPRPFIDLEEIRRGLEIAHQSNALSEAEKELLDGHIFHVKLCQDEIESSQTTPHLTATKPPKSLSRSGERSFHESSKTLGSSLRSLGASAIERFPQNNNESTKALQVVHLQLRKPTNNFESMIPSLLRQREVSGAIPARSRRGQRSFKMAVSSGLEDSLTRLSEWTNCCGDVTTLVWTSENAFICGATAHSDYHNQQYNKPGNLALGSATLDTLKAFPDHRIVRPVVSVLENAENSLHSMRQTQAPWLYTSVVATSHSEASGYTFTASFDETVKIWSVRDDGSSMALRGTWNHDKKVNFVVTSEHHELVATASEVSNDSVRVYRFDEDDITQSPYDTYNSDKALEQTRDPRCRDTWAYFPATVQWGRDQSVAHLLLVGYSPRSTTGHDLDIPVEKKNSGELCLWDVFDNARVPITSARTQNVFEVLWHPSQPCFLAATSPCGTSDPDTRTQIRVFRQNDITGAFSPVKTLDCAALDINELTIM